MQNMEICGAIPVSCLLPCAFCLCSFVFFISLL
jgi:hypothetical protein